MKKVAIVEDNADNQLLVQTLLEDHYQLYLYENGVRVGRIKLVDKKENARTFRPKSVPTNLSFHKRRIQP